MLWFSNAPDAPTQFMGLHVGQEKGAYVVRLLHPDGSQETRICDDEDTVVDMAIALHHELMVHLRTRACVVDEQLQLVPRPAWD